MTRKEKAIELVVKFIKHAQECNNSDAKQCALIAVDEIIDSHYKLLSGVNTTIYNYWQGVKQEIQNL